MTLGISLDGTVVELKSENLSINRNKNKNMTNDEVSIIKLYAQLYATWQ